MNKEGLPLVSVVIPAYNEEKHISKCLSSLLSQTYPRSCIEIIVIDGGSNDNTVKIVKKFQRKFDNVKLYHNPRKIVPVAFNIGIEKAVGKYILFMSAHTVINENYILDCVLAAEKNHALCAGGIEVVSPGGDDYVSRAIAAIMGNPVENKGLGYRENIDNVNEPKWVDFVALECYRKDVFKTYGKYNERFVRNQDLEFNLRFLRGGNKALLVPTAKVFYKTRSSIKKFVTQHFNNGFWITYGMSFSSRPFLKRHLLPLALVIFLLFLSVGCLFNLKISCNALLFLWLVYLVYILSVSFVSSRNILPDKMINKIIQFGVTTVMIFVFHLSYGIGSLVGLGKFFLNKLRWKKQ